MRLACLWAAPREKPRLQAVHQGHPGCSHSLRQGAALTARGLPPPELEAAKTSLGPIHHLDLSSFDIVAAHHELGAEVRNQVETFLLARLGSLDRTQLLRQVQRARQSRSAILQRVRSRAIDGSIRSAVRAYLHCLSAWTSGAQLDSIVRRNLKGLHVDGLPVSADDLAIFLQDEEAGCQTGVLREDERSIIMWHTEESGEPQGCSRFDKLRLASFRVPGRGGPRVITAFIYPDLLPGSAFAWSGGDFVQAVDTLHVRPSDTPSAIPVNAVTWLRLFLGGDGASAGIVRALAPFSGGYALTSVYRTASSVHADKVEFAAGMAESSALPETPGSALFQVNLFSDPASKIVLENEVIDVERRRLLERRIARTQRTLRMIARSTDKRSGISRMLASRVGGGYAYCNESVKATIIYRMSVEDASVRVGAGPAIRQDQHYSVDWGHTG